MRESVIDVLFYLFDDILPYQEEFQPDLKQMAQWLGEAGFAQQEIMRAMDWFYELSQTDSQCLQIESDSQQSVRLFSAQEKHYIDEEGQNYLRSLVRAGVIDNRLLDCIIERAVALGEPLDLEVLRWVTLIVVLNACGDRDNLILATWQDHWLYGDEARLMQ